jgi:hypothetical protein
MQTGEKGEEGEGVNLDFTGVFNRGSDDESEMRLKHGFILREQSD